jgi:hypothetical protein
MKILPRVLPCETAQTAILKLTKMIESHDHPWIHRCGSESAIWAHTGGTAILAPHTSQAPEKLRHNFGYHLRSIELIKTKQSKGAVKSNVHRFLLSQTSEQKRSDTSHGPMCHFNILGCVTSIKSKADCYCSFQWHKGTTKPHIESKWLTLNMYKLVNHSSWGNS